MFLPFFKRWQSDKKTGFVRWSANETGLLLWPVPVQDSRYHRANRQAAKCVIPLRMHAPVVVPLPLGSCRYRPSARIILLTLEPLCAEVIESVAGPPFCAEKIEREDATMRGSRSIRPTPSKRCHLHRSKGSAFFCSHRKFHGQCACRQPWLNRISEAEFAVCPWGSLSNL